TLFAPACSSAFANEHYVAAQAKGVLKLSELCLYALSDENEKADALPSRALDDVRKIPLLGMQRAQLPEYEDDADQWDAGQLPEVRQWRSAWPGAGQGLLQVVKTPEVVVTREGGRIQATHGSFDNNIAAITQAIERIKGSPLVAELEWLDY